MKPAMLDENPYSDWSAHLFTVQRTQYILLTNTASLYSCVLYGRGIRDDHQLIVRSLDAIREFTEDDQLAFLYQRFIAPATGSIRFAKALNRSVTGSMNDFVHASKFNLTNDEDLPPSELGHLLNEMPMGALVGPDGQKYGVPREAFRRLLDRT